MFQTRTENRQSCCETTTKDQRNKQGWVKADNKSVHISVVSKS